MGRSSLLLHSFGSAYKISENKELLCTPIFSDDSYDKEDFGAVSDFYPEVVQVVNDFFDTSFVANIAD